MSTRYPMATSRPSFELVLLPLPLWRTSLLSTILSQTGGTCVCEHGDPNAHPQCANQAEFDACKAVVKLDLITATCALSGTACIVFGFLTNLPVGLAPGMGLNAYFTFQVVGPNGFGLVPYRLALTAVFVEGWIFVLLALTGMRHWLVKIIPGTIKTASGVGIGLFLTLIGMSYNSGIGIITGATSTPLTIGGCPSEMVSEKTGECTGGVMTNPQMWLGVVGGGLLTAFLMAYRVKSAIVLGIAFVSILSWPRNTPLTYFPFNPVGDARFDYFKKVVAFHPMEHTLNALQWDLSGAHGVNFVLALFTFLYVDIIDCTATLYSMARFCHRTKDRQGDFPRATVAYCTDAVMISLGALLGCSPVTVFVESGAGIAEGGRTGLTGIVTGICFLISIFFAPIFASIPPWATGCTLIIVGCLMIRQVVSINWAYIGDAVPSFVTLTFIPFSYSVAYGLIAGLFTYTGLNLMIGFIMWVSRGALVPKDYDQKEYWTWKPAGEKPILLRLFSRHQRWGGDGSDSDSNSQDGNDHHRHNRHRDNDDILGTAKDAHLSLDGESAVSVPHNNGNNNSRSVGSRSIASRSRAGSTVDGVRRPPTPGPFRSLH
ncbi:permease family-domain-containing protein [Coniochaeta sp. 2T2.1]|nr:permease family-domain-containing protein [Coniochaeta sp. 2T2.1]